MSLFTIPRTRTVSMQRVARTGLAALFVLLTAGPAIADIPIPKVAGEPYNVGGDVERPVKVHAPAPEYTQEARDQRVQGVTILQVVIDRQGNVRSPEVLKGLPYGLSEAAVDAVSKWKFEPATKDGEPVEVFYNLTINFRLDSKEVEGPKREQRSAEPFYVMDDVERPQKLQAPAPDYTAEARENRVQGIIIMQVTIDRDGRVKDPQVLKGLPFGLDEKAIETVSRWTFEPATRNGEPVSVLYNLTFNFRLD